MVMIMVWLSEGVRRKLLIGLRPVAANGDEADARAERE
jgi:hypothetical protein